MPTLLHTTLVIMTLLSQILGGTAVLCVEGDGSLLLEFQLGACCDPVEDAGSNAATTEEAGDCGSCQDLSLAQRNRCERELDDLGWALDLASAMTLVAFPRAVIPASEASLPRAPEALRAREARDTGDLVSATVVLIC